MDTMTASTMSMTLFTSTTTPLYSTAWTPSSKGTYALTCLFLIILGIISRGLSIWRSQLEDRWHARAVNRRYIVVADPNGATTPLAEKVRNAGSDAVLTARGVDESVRVVRTEGQGKEGKPWRLSVDVPRAGVFVLQAGVGYLLMLAIMTMNVGYFLSVLAGLGVGELFLGRLAPHAGVHL